MLLFCHKVDFVFSKNCYVRKAGFKDLDPMPVLFCKTDVSVIESNTEYDVFGALMQAIDFPI